MTTRRELRTIIEAVADDTFSDVYTCFPARVVHYDHVLGRVDVVPVPVLDPLSPSGTRLFGPWIDGVAPKLVNVPVMWPRGGDYALTFPLRESDFVLVMSMDEASLDFVSENFDPTAPTTVPPLRSPPLYEDEKILIETGAVRAPHTRAATPEEEVRQRKPWAEVSEERPSRKDPEVLGGPRSLWTNLASCVAIPGWFPGNNPLPADYANDRDMVLGNVAKGVVIRFTPDGKINLGGSAGAIPVALAPLVQIAIRKAIESHTHLFVDSQTGTQETAGGAFDENFNIPDVGSHMVSCSA